MVGTTERFWGNLTLALRPEVEYDELTTSIVGERGREPRRGWRPREACRGVPHFSNEK